MPTLRERLTDLREKIRARWLDSMAPASFGIKDDRGEMYFVRADRLTLDKSGRLLFRRRWAICAAVAEGKWERVLKGITLDDVEAKEGEEL